MPSLYKTLDDDFVLKVPVSGRSQINRGSQKCFLNLPKECQLTVTENDPYSSKFQGNLGAGKKPVWSVKGPGGTNIEVIFPSLKIDCSLSILLKPLKY